MKLGVGFRLGLWMAALGTLSIGLVGYYAYKHSRAALTAAVEAKLLTATRTVSQRFTYAVDRSTDDLVFLRSLKAVQRVGAATGTLAGRASRDELADIFAGMLQSHGEYLQIRLIGTADHGLELVRVDRADNAVRRVPESELREKGFLPDVYNTLKLADGEIHISPIDVSREREQGLPARPTLRIACPVFGRSGVAFGMLIITVGIDELFKQIQADVPTTLRTILTNQQGDYLIHPDTERAFGFTRGRRQLVQADVPAITPLLGGGQQQLVLTSARLDNRNEQAIGAFVDVPFSSLASNQHVILGMYSPLAEELRESTRLGVQIVQFTVTFALLAGILSLLLSRWLARPLNAMSQAVANYEVGQSLRGLPIARDDEIGALAQSFAEMIDKITRQTAELKTAMGQLMESEKLAALGSLVAGVAHELNTPLGNSLVVATALKDQVEEFDKAMRSNLLRRSTIEQFIANARTACKLIERNADRSAELVASFKSVAVDQTSELRRTFDLAQVAAETLTSLAPSYRGLPVTIDNRIPPGLMLDSYPGPLGQVIINLVNNAIVHALGERAHLTIALGAVDAGETIDLCIADDGQGMDEATAKRALEPFFTTRLGTGGSGLGLYLVYNLVTGTLGGRLRFDSAPGEGTRFHIDLPKTASRAPQ